MSPTLESFLIALAMLVAPGGPPFLPDRALPPSGNAALVDCRHFADRDAQQKCIARVSRSAAKTKDTPYPTQLSWVEPRDPGMPDRFEVLRSLR